MSLISNDYYTTSQVAKMHGVTQKTVYRWIKSGRLQAEEFQNLLWIGKAQAEEVKRDKRGRRAGKPSTRTPE